MLIESTDKLELGAYYRINSTKKILYWDGSEWMKPIGDRSGRKDSWVQRLDKQPKFKFAEKVEVTELYNQ